MTQFITRAYNNFAINSKTLSSIKKTSTEPRLGDEIDYYKNLPRDISLFFPRLYDSNQATNFYEMELEYYAYSNLGKLMIEQPFNQKLWEQIFAFILNYLSLNRLYSTKSRSTDCYLMFIKKTQEEYYKLVNNFPYFNELTKHDVILNGKPLLKFETIWDKLKTTIENDYLTIDNFNLIHGDLCFSNILYGINPISNDVILKFIDPRGKFGSCKFYGDPYYDLAKLSHSCNGGYEYLINDQFVCNQTTSTVFELTYKNSNKEFVNQVFHDNIKTYDSKKIKLLEGTIFIGMCARHYDSLERQKAMYLTGLQILNEVYSG